MKDLLSQRKKRSVSLEETLEFLVDEGLERHDPLKKAQRAQARKEKQKKSSVPTSCVARHVNLAKEDFSMKRKSLPAEVKHQVLLRDHGRCTYQDSQGKRCEEKRWIDFHHDLPLSQGGLNLPENIKTLCFSHHKMVHHH